MSCCADACGVLEIVADRGCDAARGLMEDAGVEDGAGVAATGDEAVAGVCADVPVVAGFLRALRVGVVATRERFAAVGVVARDLLSAEVGVVAVGGTVMTTSSTARADWPACCC